MYYLFGFYFFILGAVFGSFLSCLAWRFYSEKNVWPASRCDFCGRKLSWFENIPVLSYLLLKGKCSACRKKINWQYFAAELFGGLLFAAAFFVFFGNNQYFFSILPSSSEWQQLIFSLLALTVLLFVMIYDGRYYLVSLPFVIGASLIFYIFNLFLGVQWFWPLISGAIGGVFFLIQYLLTKRKGIGEGDIYLGILLGFIFPELSNLFLFAAIFISYLIGALFGLFLIVIRQKKLGSALPLGFFLALGGMITILFGSDIVSWYLGWL